MDESTVEGIPQGHREGFDPSGLVGIGRWYRIGKGGCVLGDEEDSLIGDVDGAIGGSIDRRVRTSEGGEGGEHTSDRGQLALLL